MKKLNLIALILVIGSNVYSQSSATQIDVKARFVAHDRFAWMTSYRNPRQPLIVEIAETSGFSDGALIRVLYFPKPVSKPEALQYLQDNVLTYAHKWEMRLRPVSATEGYACADMEDNFMRVANKKKSVFSPNNDPALRFRSTSFPGYVAFENLKGMPCFVLESFSTTSHQAA
jgi:hypothetical protein